ncbi:unnamed protein product [Effrenium voratum]|nr:unnamed protein product [Effrenium voratum]
MGKADAEAHAPAWRKTNKAAMKELALFRASDGSPDGVLWYWVSAARKVCVGLYNNLKNEKLIVTFNGAKEAALAAPEEPEKKGFRCKVKGDIIAFTVLPGEMVLAFDKGDGVPGFVPELCPLTAADYEATFGADAVNGYEANLEKVKALIAEKGLDSSDDLAVLKACVETKTRFVDVNFTKEAVMGSGQDCPGVFLCPEQYLRDGQTKCLFKADESGEKVTPEDVGQGVLGDCWLMAAFAALSEWPERVYSMFGLDGNPCYGNEVGGYVIHHTKDGKWRYTVVDDYLIVRGVGPMFARNRKNPAELWVSVLEKAWAKVHGGYKVLQVGRTHNAMTDLTGYPSNIFMFDPEDRESVLLDGHVKTEFWSCGQLGEQLAAWDDKHFAMNLQTEGADQSSFDQKNSSTFGLEEEYKKIGLFPGHAYTLYGVQKVNGTLLCQIRNPWGSGAEWTGDWSDRSKLWESVDEEKRIALLGRKPDNTDGMFWMSLQDVSKHFKGGSVTFIGDSDDLRFIGTAKGQATFAVRFKNTTPGNRVSFMASQPDVRNHGGSYAALQVRLMVKADGGWRLAKSEDLSGQPPATRWRMDRDLGFSTTLAENTEYLVTLVTDAKDKDVVLAVQPSKGSEYAAEAFSVPAEAAFLQRTVESEAVFEVDTSAKVPEDLKQQMWRAV